MNAEERPKMPFAQRIYGEIIYVITIVAAIICMIGPVISMANPDRNVMNPHYLFSSIFEGKSTEQVWEEVAGGFPAKGGHFYLDHFTFGDGITQFGLALGCSCALWGLLAAAVCYLREKNYLYVLLSIWVGALILLSLIGIIAGH
jgi:hypothetical protein